MLAIEYLKSLPKYLLPRYKMGDPSNSEIYRMLKSGSVKINGETAEPNSEVEFPVTELVFFPKGRRRTTII